MFKSAGLAWRTARRRSLTHAHTAPAAPWKPAPTPPPGPIQSMNSEVAPPLVGTLSSISL